MSTMSMTKDDLDAINEAVKLFDLKFFTLIKDSSSGIGYTIDLEFDHSMNYRDVKTRVAIADSDNW